MLSNLLNDIT